ncbi:hypothetical protein [Pseudoflavonifractor sp. MSJ-37]|uniref:hypothetical protein n=1 Tax=Pseudoflavonifractor sp. MSJ-37 TaxID=2841531 RepID=UPI001C0F5FD5|nr:hypothetical protein [Pseudoflavonifractor sp. MSJ-37]MBU5434997.1 hypothetical protein [Pseudoflavonifractor sp. MSJ-37]
MSETTTSYHTVRLLKNHVYPTYQLFAVMGERKTSPQAGLRLGALTVMRWLRDRLGPAAPAELEQAPDPADYLDTDDSCLCSLHMNEGFVIDLVSAPEQGMWSLQITEPDLGSDPGNEGQARPAVPGRVLETNVAFRITSEGLECGFQTRISDPDGSQEKAEVYRLAFIRPLLRDPAFGLRQIAPLREQVERIGTVEQLKAVARLWRDKRGQLPLVLFTQLCPEKAPLKVDQRIKSFLPQSTFVPFDKEHPLMVPQQNGAPVDPPYDMDGLARSAAAFCRCYLVEEGLRKKLAELTGAEIGAGDIVRLEPMCFGGACRVDRYRPSAVRQNERMAELKEWCLTYPREKAVTFGSIKFLSDARESLLSRTAEAEAAAQQIEAQWREKLEQMEAAHKAELAQLAGERQALLDKLDRQKQFQLRLEREKEELRAESEREKAKLCQELEEEREENAYLKRRMDRPALHGEIAAWVERHFRDRLYLHPKAVALLADRSAQGVDAALICDALDFLATDYWDRRYAKISEAEMLTRCSEKYGRPFEIKPTGTATVEFTPAQYKIKYFPGHTGVPVESPLDYHLGVGNAPENLLRIYFLHDDRNKLIVVGSLPRHLKAVSIK